MKLVREAPGKISSCSCGVLGIPGPAAEGQDMALCPGQSEPHTVHRNRAAAALGRGLADLLLALSHGVPSAPVLTVPVMPEESVSLGQWTGSVLFQGKGLLRCLF